MGAGGAGAGSGNDTVVICYGLCFNSQSIIEVIENGKLVKKTISEIKKGELVQTYNGNSKCLTEVTKIKKNEGLFECYEFKCRSNASNTKYISVTGSHIMIVFGKGKDEIKFKKAEQIKVGESFRTSEGILEIIEINKKTMKDCFQLKTEDGTVLANDILVSTLYLEDNENQKKLQKVLESSKIPIEILN